MSQQEYDNEKRGVLFRNNEKQKDSQPDYKGRVQVNGEEYWLSAWVNTSKKGEKYMSLSLQEMKEAHDQGVRQVKRDNGFDPGESFEDKDVPF